MRSAARAWASASVWTVAVLTPCAARADPSFTLSQVAPGVYAAIAQPGNEAAVGNAGVIVGTDAVVVVDSFATPRAAQELLAAIRDTTRQPVRWLVDTHHHLDHSGGNAVFAKAGAIVIAHENARAAMREASLARIARAPAGDREEELRGMLPSETYRDSISLWIGDRRVDVFSKPGHTNGDSLVSVPDANVLFGGDLLQKATIPNLADADTAAWIRTLDELARRFPSAILVPGHGTIARPLDMRGLREYLVNLRAGVASQIRAGNSGARLSEALLPQLQSLYHSWNWSERIPDNVAHVEAELKGTPASVPQPTP